MSRHTLVVATAVAMVATACGGSQGAPSTTAPPTSVLIVISTTSTALVRGEELVEEGDRGGLVATLQHLLTCGEYGDLVADGVFGPVTARAVEKAEAALLGPVNGIVDDKLLTDLATACDTPQRLIFPTGEATVSLAGYAAAGTRDRFRLDAIQGQVMTVIAGVPFQVIGDNGKEVFDAGSGHFVIPATETYTILPAAEDVSGAYDVTVALAALPDSFVAVEGPALDLGTGCLQTAGSGAFEISFAEQNTTIALEGGMAIVGHDRYIDAEATVSGGFTEGRVDGGGTIGKGSDRLPLAFGFTTEGMARCDGFTLVGDLVLGADGLGIVPFGWEDDESLIDAAVAWLGAAAPDADTGWLAVTNPANSPRGACRAGTTELRVVRVGPLTLAFWDVVTDFAPDGGRHFTAWAQRGAGPNVMLATTLGLALGDEVGYVAGVYPDATTTDDGVLVLDDPDGDPILEAVPADDLIAELRAGAFCTRRSAD